MGIGLSGTDHRRPSRWYQASRVSISTIDYRQTTDENQGGRRETGADLDVGGEMARCVCWRGEARPV